MIQIKMVSDYSGYKAGNQYWIEDKQGISFLNKGMATYVGGGNAVQLTMLSAYQGYVSGQSYWFTESFASMMIKNGLARYDIKNNISSVPLNAVSSTGNCPAPGTVSDLSGSVAHTTANGVGAKQKETITLTGTCGSATIVLLGKNFVIPFNTSLTVTAERFAEQYAHIWMASKINLIASTNTLVFESTTNNVPFTAPTISNNFATIVANAVGSNPANVYYVLAGVKGSLRSVISSEIVVSQGNSTTKLNINFTGTELFDYVVLYSGTSTGTYTKATKVQSGFWISSNIPNITSPLVAYSTFSALSIIQVTTYSTYGVPGKVGDVKLYNGKLYGLATDNTIYTANWTQSVFTT